MLSVFNDSQAKWSISCNYNIDEVVTDLVRVPVSSFDPFTNKDACIEVDYVSIRDHKCSQCEVYVLQTDDRAIHIKPRRSLYKCGFDMISGFIECDDMWEQSFGIYKCSNSLHRCSSSSSSTTQMWFGSS